MIKRTDAAGHSWLIYDSTRSGSNFADDLLYANTNAAENPLTNRFQFLSNGFKILTDNASHNASGGTYIYMAFAADPDTEAPAVAKSFGIQTWSGDNSTTRTIDGYGFEPSLAWIKWRTGTYGHSHMLFTNLLNDPNANSGLSTNSTAALNGYKLTTFTDDGFQFASPINAVNETGFTFVGWAWKADDNEPTIFSPSQTVADIKSTNITLNLNLAGGSYSGSGSAIEDLSSAEEDFTVTNATVPSGFGGYYIDFDGSGDYADSDSSIATTSGNDITIEFWIRPESATQTSYAMIIDANHSTAVSGSTGQGWCIQQTASTSNSYYFVYYDGSTYQSNSDAQLFTLTNGVWSHIAIVKSGTSVQVYKDGTAGTSWTASNGNLANPNQKIRLGGWLAGGRDFNGNIAQVRLYSDALSSSQVTANYNATKGLFTTIQSIVSANANAGFSIVKYEGNGVAGSQVTHGLSAAPEMIIAKSISDAYEWKIWHKDLSSGYQILFNTAAQASDPSVWTTTTPTSTAFSVGTNVGVNQSTKDYIAYCFHSVAGFSKFGSYTGTGTTNSITGLGFQPDWLMIKRATGGSSNGWVICDSVRGVGVNLRADTTGGEVDESAYTTSFDSDGFTLAQAGGNTNVSGSTYIYAAFKIN